MEQKLGDIHHFDFWTWIYWPMICNNVYFTYQLGVQSMSVKYYAFPSIMQVA